ncbi:MAG: ExbD/TolR family protein [Burkholderiaceae bacterium]
MNVQKSWKRFALAIAMTMSTNAAFGESAQSPDVRLVVTDSGQYILSGRAVALSDLRARLRELKAIGGPINFHVTGSPNVEYKYLMPAMQIVQEEGLAKVGLLTVPPAQADSPASGTSK